MENLYERKKPEEQVVSFDFFQAFGNGIPDEDKSICEHFIAAAELSIEQATNRILKKSSFDLTIYGRHPIGVPFRILRSPLQSITSVHQGGTTLDYKIQKTPSYSLIWFDLISEIEEIKVVFEAGYEKTPEDLLDAVLKTALFHYTNRGDVSTDAMNQLPFEVLPIIKKNKITPL